MFTSLPATDCLIVAHGCNSWPLTFSRVWPPLATTCCRRLALSSVSELTESQSHVTTDCQSVSHIWSPRTDLCYFQTFAVLSMWGALSDERMDVSFTSVKISHTCHLYLQFYMSVFCILSCQEPCSLWIPSVYCFTCSSAIYMYVQYIQGLCQSRLVTADHALTHADNVTTAA
jgi:DNA-directed RNA polymerase subunit N (RpoN/RPB10)